MVSLQQLCQCLEKRSVVFDRNGAKVGRIGQIYLDEGGEPSWIMVQTGLGGTSESAIPVREAHADSDAIHVPYPVNEIEAAPRMNTGWSLTPDEQTNLCDYYGLPPRDRGRSETEAGLLPGSGTAPAHTVPVVPSRW